VKALTTFGSGKTIYFKSFDLDDPSTDAAPMDSNGSLGNDNRGGSGTAAQYGILSIVGGSGTTNSVSAATDANGIASADLTVTMQPGDNFMVAASHDQTETALPRPARSRALRGAQPAQLPVCSGSVRRAAKQVLLSFAPPKGSSCR